MQDRENYGLNPALKCAQLRFRDQDFGVGHAIQASSLGKLANVCLPSERNRFLPIYPNRLFESDWPKRGSKRGSWPKRGSQWVLKRAWYDKHFPGRLVTTLGSGKLSPDAEAVIRSQFP